jgi:hypothetical protein
MSYRVHSRRVPGDHQRVVVLTAEVSGIGDSIRVEFVDAAVAPVSVSVVEGINDIVEGVSLAPRERVPRVLLDAAGVKEKEELLETDLQ